MAVSVQYIEDHKREEFEELIDGMRAIKIAPFQLVSGAYDVVNGAIKQNPNVNNETQYDKVFTGQNSTILIWRDSTKLVLKDSSEDPQGPNGNYLPNQFKRQYTVGKLYDFYLDTETTALASEGGSASTLSNLTGFILGDIEESNLYDAYVIPSVGPFVYKFQVGIKYRLKDNNEVLYTEVSLTKVNKIGTTDDIDQVFQLTNSLGEGYAWPTSQLVEDNEVISLDQSKLQDDPIKYIQIELEDPSVNMGMYMYGRRATYGSGNGKEFSAPELLFPINFQSTDGNKLSGQIAPSDYYVYSNDLSISLDTYYDSWVEKVLTKYSPEAIRQFEGHITDRKKETTLLTNPKASDTKFGNTYWDNWTFNTTDKTVSILSPFAEESFVYEATTTYTMEDINASLVFRHQHIQKLPISDTETTPRVATEIPILGIIGKVLFVGTDSGWYNTDALRNRVGEVGGFINKDYYQLLNSTSFNESTEIAPLPLDAFGEDRPETIMGIGTMPNIWKFELSDTFFKNGTEHSTSELGIKKDNSGVLWNITDTTLTSSTATGWAIDTPVIQTIGKTVIRLTAYNIENKAVYSVRYETTSKRTGDTRDITTIFNTSAWTFEELVEVPEVVIPEPPDTPEVIIYEPESPYDTEVNLKPEYITTEFSLQTLLTEANPDADIADFNKFDIEIAIVESSDSPAIGRPQDITSYVADEDPNKFNYYYTEISGSQVWKYNDIKLNFDNKITLFEFTRSYKGSGLFSETAKVDAKLNVSLDSATKEIKFECFGAEDITNGSVVRAPFGESTSSQGDYGRPYIRKITFRK